MGQGQEIDTGNPTDFCRDHLSNSARRGCIVYSEHKGGEGIRSTDSVVVSGRGTTLLLRKARDKPASNLLPHQCGGVDRLWYADVIPSRESAVGDRWSRPTA
jgi:hypothetical protein